MVYTHQDIEEFDKQIKELLDKGLIRNSRSPQTGPTFMVRNVAKKREEKLEWYSITKSSMIIPSLMAIIFPIKWCFST